MKYIDADRLRAEIDRQKIGYNINGKHAAEYDTCVKILRIIDSLQQERREVDLEREVEKYLLDNADFVTKSTSNEMVNALARHFAEWGARHSINWGDVQLLDTFILELSREEKDGTDWGDSEKFYTEVLRRFHEFNDKKISEIVAEWGAEHARKEE